MGKLDCESENTLDSKVFATERPKAFSREDNNIRSYEPFYYKSDGVAVKRKPLDNLTVGQGEFPKKIIEEFPKVEKVLPARRKDNLKSEGRFYGKRNSDFRNFATTRPTDVRIRDSLQLSKEPLDLVTTKQVDFGSFIPEKRRQVRHSDNLKLENSEFAKRERQASPIFDRIPPVKYHDNLTVTGKFLGHRNSDYAEFPIDRRKPIIQKDNIQLASSGIFDSHTMQQTEFSNYSYIDRARPIIHSDNLKLNHGEFTKKEIPLPPVMDRVYPMKYQESLKMEGEFFGERNSDFIGYPIDKQKAIHQENNIRISTDPFDAVSMNTAEMNIGDFVPEARKPIIKHDNLQLEKGEFAQKYYQEIPKLEKVCPVKHNESLTMDGEFYGSRKSDYAEYLIEKQKPIRKEDNIHLSTERFENVSMKQSQYTDFVPEITRPIRQSDNLRLDDGQFTKREVPAFPILERASPVKYIENLRSEGEFFGQRKSDFREYSAIQKQKPIRQSDNILLSSDPFEGVTMQQMQYRSFTPEIIRPVVHRDNIQLENAQFTQKEVQPFPNIEMVSPYKYNDTLKMDGEFFGKKNVDYSQYVLDRQKPIRREDHLHLNTDPFDGLTMQQTQYINIKSEEPAKKIIPSDNLKLEEGEFTKREVASFPVMERASPVKYHETLKVDGEFYGERKSDYQLFAAEKQKPIIREDNIHLSTEKFEAITTNMKESQLKNFTPEMAKPIIQSDHLHLSREPFEGVTMKQSQFTQFKPEVSKPIIPSGNLKLEEGEFTKREVGSFPVFERASPVKYHETLKMDGEFYGERKSDFKEHSVAKQKPIIREDNIHLSSEPFEAVTMAQIESQFKNFTPEMAKPIIPSDNLKLEEGEFTKREVPNFPQMDKVLPVKYTETLQIDGEFFGERNSDYREFPIERQNPIRQEDNLHLNTDPFLAVTMQQTQYKTFTPELTRSIAPRDHIQIEDAEFTKRVIQPFPTIERASPIKHFDTLKVEQGEFAKRSVQDSHKIERTSPIKHFETLKVEGEFLGERNPDYKEYPIEKVKPFRQEDNLHLSTDPFHAVSMKQSQFDFLSDFKPERTQMIRVEDKIKLEQGEFTKREVEVPHRIERASPIKHFGTLKVEEGEFTKRQVEEPHKIERASPIKHFESLKVEGEFYGERKSDYGEYPIEKPKPFRQEDNLHLSTDQFHAVSMKQSQFDFLSDFKPERTQMIRVEDKIKLEQGDFTKRELQVPYKIERTCPIKQLDTLKIEEGEFTKRSVQALHKIERTSPIKHFESLKVEGDFYGDRNSDYREYQIEKVKPIRQEDNLHLNTDGVNFQAVSMTQSQFLNFKPEKTKSLRRADNLQLEQGEFTKREVIEVPYKIERAAAIKHLGTLKVEEGEFTKRQVEAPHKIERTSPIKHFESLKLDGEFYGERKSDYREYPIERPKPFRQEDNLHLNTEKFQGTTVKQAEFLDFKPEKAKSLRKADNIKLEQGEFAKREVEIPQKIERTSPIKHFGTLKVEEGEFTKRQVELPHKMERTSPIKHFESLKVDGEFYGERRSDYKEYQIEKLKPFRQEDNLHLNTDPFNAVTIKQSEFLEFKPEKAKSLRKADNIKLEEGEFTKREVGVTHKIERASPIKHIGTLKIEQGEFTKRQVEVPHTIERTSPIKHFESLKLDGEFYGERKSDYREYPIEKPKPFRQEDNLHLSTDPFNTGTIKQSEFLEFKPEKAKSLRKADNIKLEQGEFTKREVDVPHKIERASPIKHFGTLKVEEGEFTKRKVQTAYKIERTSPIKHFETLKVDGEFYGERKSDYKEYPIEKLKPFRQEDNLHLNTDPFQGTTTKKQSEFLDFKPEKAKSLRKADNIKVEQGEFTKRPVDVPYKMERTSPIKQFDTLKVEVGEFTKRKVQTAYKIERTSPIKHFETLKVDGEFYGERKSDYKEYPIEKLKPFRQEDNLHLNTEPFQGTTTKKQSEFLDFKPEKAKSLRKADNIKLEQGDFTKRPVDVPYKIERVSPIKHFDTLKVGQGEFTKRPVEAPYKIERTSPIKHFETLKVAGEFYGERNSDYKEYPIEKLKPCRLEDNLHLNTEPFQGTTMQQSAFAEFKPEKTKSLRIADNIKLEQGQFTKRDVTDGPYSKIEKNVPIKHSDTLKVGQGEFSKRQVELAPKIERASPIKQLETLKVSGEFYGERNSDYKEYPVEKLKPIKHEDNLHLNNGSFTAHSVKQSHYTNFKPEKSNPIRMSDNIKVGKGEFTKREVPLAPKIDRVSPVKFAETLKPSGEFYMERSSDYKAFPIEKTKSVRFADNIKVNEGDFSKREVQPVYKMEKVAPFKYPDTLKPSGEFYGKRNSAYKEFRVERQKPIHQEDNIHLNTEKFTAKSMQKKEFKYHKPEKSRAIVHSDNIKLLEGEFTKRDVVDAPYKIERVAPYKYYDTLKADGEFYGKRNSDYKQVLLIERPKPIRAKDNIQLSTEPFRAVTMNQSQYVYV